jgi:hypothetical protein
MEMPLGIFFDYLPVFQFSCNPLIRQSSSKKCTVFLSQFTPFETSARISGEIALHDFRIKAEVASSLPIERRQHTRKILRRKGEARPAVESAATGKSADVIWLA